MNKNSVVPGLHTFFTRTGLLAIGLSLALMLSACNLAAAQPDTSILTQVATDVVASLTAQPSATASMTPTPTLTPTPTTIPTATSTVGIPVSGGVVSSGSGAFGCNNSVFVADTTIPDGTVLAPGQSFTKKWELRNIGSCKWTPEYSIVFVGGDNMGGASNEIGKTVNVNKKGEAAVKLVAPTVDGTYTGLWRMADQNGNLFGETIDVQIVVEQGVVVTVVVTATPVPPTPTPTP